MGETRATVIDVGINRTRDGLSRDLDCESVSQVAEAIRPAPGGVGPMTIAQAAESVNRT